MILTFYGEGKGKTSAALGIALRASGYGKKILFCQFIKGNWDTGEDKALKRIKNLIHKKFGLGFVKKGDSEQKRLKDIKAAQAGFDFVKTNTMKYDIVILDEILIAIELGFIKKTDLLIFLKNNPNCDYVLTGRPKINEIIEISDYVSEIKKFKHPFDRGIIAKKGIDY